MRETVRFPHVVKKQSSPRGCDVSQITSPWHDTDCGMKTADGLITNFSRSQEQSGFGTKSLLVLNKDLSLGHILKNWSPGHMQAAETAGKFYCLSKNQIRHRSESKRPCGISVSWQVRPPLSFSRVVGASVSPAIVQVEETSKKFANHNKVTL